MTHPDFSHYEIILQRKPFGAPPPVVIVQPPQPTIAPEDAFIKNLRLCAITEDDDGIRVGLVDLMAKPPKSYFLYVGDIEDGIELVQADYAKESALLRKGVEEYWISMVDDKGMVIATPASTPTPTGGIGEPSGVVMPPGVGVATERRLSYAERLRKRREAEEARMQEIAARPQLEPEEMEKKLQDFQMQVIRRGEPPLPIPLTPEMDDQLVAEGVLPPLE